MPRPRLTITLTAAAAFTVAIQFIPYQAHNPPTRQEPTWDTPDTRALAKRACYDCHSNEVSVPWYGRIAPVSWVVRHHVDEGRAALNFSEMDRPQHEADEAAEEVAEGHMPPWYYTPMHSSAQLSAAERERLVRGLQRTLGGDGDDGEATDTTPATLSGDSSRGIRGDDRDDRDDHDDHDDDHDDHDDDHDDDDDDE